MDAGFLRAYVPADVLLPEIGGHQDAGLLLAISFRDQEVELVAPSTELTCVHLPSRVILHSSPGINFIQSLPPTPFSPIVPANLYFRDSRPRRRRRETRNFLRTPSEQTVSRSFSRKRIRLSAGETFSSRITRNIGADLTGNESR